MNLNLIQLIGRITRDPEVKGLPSGTTVAKFAVATNHIFKGKDGEKNETAQFHNCVAFGKIAETIGKWVKKGQEIYITGRVEYRTWDKKDGGKGYATEIVVENFQFGAKPKNSGASSAEVESEQVPDFEGEIRVEDIPF